MTHNARLFWMATALAVASGMPAAQAAKSTSPERKAAVEKIARNHGNFKQPQTMAEAEQTEVRMADGTVALAVPEELWNNLSVQADAQGKLQVRESDGTASTVASHEGLSNE